MPMHPEPVSRFKLQLLRGTIGDLSIERGAETRQDWERIAREAPPPELADGQRSQHQNK